MATWDDEDVDALELFLLRAKATALSERNDMQRLYGAYGDRRISLAARLNEAERDLTTIERLLLLTTTLRSGTMRH